MDRSTCAYTSAEGRACRNPMSPGPYCVHHTCGGCGGAKQSRRIGCETCLAKAAQTRQHPNSTSGAPAAAVPGGPRKSPTKQERAVLAARAMADQPLTDKMVDSLKIFGDDGPTRMRRGHGDIAHKFNYTAVEFSAESVFRAHDADHSGTIDGTELEQILYDCGVRVTPDTLAMAKSLLGLKGPDDTCTLETFEKWWKATYAKSRAARAALLQKLEKDVEEFLIPELKTLFAEYDADCSGALDPAEFQKFYPRLREFLGYEIPPLDQCIKQMDEVDDGKAGDRGDGLVEYEEFEAWFLQQEHRRLAQATQAQTGRGSK